MAIMRLQCSLPCALPIAFLLSAVLVLSLLPLLAQAAGEDRDPAGRKARWSALIMFGASVVDPGNNNVLITPVKANFPPYGINFVNHTATGRFSDGKILPDYMASKFGMKNLLRAYLDPNLDQDDMLTGVSFGSAGTGYDPRTARLVSVLSLPEQLRLFKEYLEKVRAIAGEAHVQEILSNGMFMIYAGSNDVTNTYYSFRARSTYSPTAYVKLLLQYASSFIESLIREGVKRIGVSGIPPVGCEPAQRTLKGGLQRECASNENEMAAMFNAGLPTEMKRIKDKYPGLQLSYIDLYNAMAEMLQNAQSYGFNVTTRSCCGTGLLEVSLLCNSLTASVCANVSDHLFWDGVHLTDRADKILVDLLYDKYTRQI